MVLCFLQKHGLKIYLRDPDSYTPCLKSGRSLLLGRSMEENKLQIAQFSEQDAEVKMCACLCEDSIGNLLLYSGVGL